MKTDKNNMYRLIKKKHILPAILGLLLVYCLVAFLAVVISDVIVTYLCEAKMESEYKSVSYMAGIYESASDKDSIKGFLDREGRDYFIIDSDKTVLFSKGNTDTCSFTGGQVTAAGLDTFVKVYYDNACDALKVKNEELTIQFFSLFDIIHQHNVFSKLFNTDDSTRSISIPLDFWISIDLADGSGSFVAKAAYAINEKDIAMIFVLAIALAFSALVLFIALIIRIVRKFTNQKKLLSVFFTDPITQGHNWVWFTIKGEQLLHKKKNDKLNYAMLNISLVKYNTYCVCHSVEEGELVLQNVNKMISKSITKYDACAHHGTSSFAVLMQYSDEELLNKKVKFILRHLNGVDPTHKFAFHVGIALLPAIQYPDGKYASRKNIDIEKVYNDACAASATLDSSDDSAIAFFDNKLIEEQRWIDIVNEKQQKALDNEEFVIYYQPKYNPSTDELRGAEALIRWQSPEFGFVTPGRIIPIFEKNGFITEIDHYMITHVARDQKRWLDAGFRCVPVSVNVSRAHFIESDLAEQIRDAVDKEGSPRELIEIELTESAFFDDKKALITTIEKLKSYGFAVSMDDFGAGYSSLNSLKDMPLDVLKLDADFFRGENEGNRGEIVVSEAIRLAKALNMRTVAEGVEVKEQVEFLAGQGCDMIQGYYYAKPMAGTDYEQRMGRKTAAEEDNPQLPSPEPELSEEADSAQTVFEQEAEACHAEPQGENLTEQAEELVAEQSMDVFVEQPLETFAEQPEEAFAEQPEEAFAEQTETEMDYTTVEPQGEILTEQADEILSKQADEIVSEQADEIVSEQAQEIVSEQADEMSEEHHQEAFTEQP